MFGPRRALSRLQVLGELAGFLRARRLWWLMPMLAVLLLTALLLLLSQSSALAPLLYPLF